MIDSFPETPVQKRRGPRAVVATVVLVALLGVGGWYASHLRPTTSVPAAAAPRRSPISGTHLFDQVMAAVSQRYVDSIDVGTLYEKAVTGMLGELGDPYTSFLTQARFK